MNIKINWQKVNLGFLCFFFFFFSFPLILALEIVLPYYGATVNDHKILSNDDFD